MRRERLISAIWPVLLGLVACTHVGPRVPSPAPVEGDAFHADFDSFLRRHVVERGWVDYEAATKDRADLDRYISLISTTSPDNRPELFRGDSERLAYWINAYNASAIQLVLDAYPIESVRDLHPPALFFLPRVASFFFLRQITLGGQRTNLYALENSVIRERFADPRVHFALNCASQSCPELPDHAFLPSRLDAQLREETERFLSSDRNVRISREGVLEISAIFDWYDSDFEQWMEAERPSKPATLAGYIADHVPADADPALTRCSGCRTRFRDYDWGLNDIALRPAAP